MIKSNVLTGEKHAESDITVTPQVGNEMEDYTDKIAAYDRQLYEEMMYGPSSWHVDINYNPVWWH